MNNQHQVWVIPVRDLIHQPGHMREVTLNIQVPEQLGAGVIVVPENKELSLDVRLESVHEGILATADIETVAIGECARCSNEVRLPIAVNFQELFGYEDGDGIEYIVQDDAIDVTAAVRDAVVLALPFSPVCEQGCEDLQLTEGVTFVSADDAQPFEPDPRWAKLKDFNK